MRTRETIGLVLVLGILIIVVLGLGLAGSAQTAAISAASILWVSYIFGGVLCFEKTMAIEKHDGALVMERRPDYILIGNVDITDQPRTSLIPPLDREVDIVTNDFFQKNYEQIHLSVAGGKYLNLFRRKGL